MKRNFRDMVFPQIGHRVAVVVVVVVEGFTVSSAQNWLYRDKVDFNIR